MVNCGTLTVLAPVDADDVNLVGCSLSPGTLDLAEGTVVEAAVTVENRNNADVTVDARLVVGGTQVNSIASAVISANSQRTFNLTFGGFAFPLGEGEYSVEFPIDEVAHSVSAGGASGIFRSLARGCSGCGGRSRRIAVSNPLRR